MRFILPLLSLAAAAATGDITAIRIVGASDTRLHGWAAEIDIEGLSTGGTYSFGFGANNAPGANTPYCTVTSPGYDDTGASTTMQRQVYITNTVRKPYPDNALNAETDNATYVTVRVALDDWIYISDTLTCTIPAGFYTQGVNTSNAVSAMAVTNNSTEAYPRVVGNWSWPGYSRITGSSITLRAVAFHRSARQKRPVRAVKFTCTDQHANSATATVTNATIDAQIGDALPVQEYTGSVSTTGMTSGDVVTCNFAAYPWFGDSGSVLNTGDGANTHPTPLYAPQYYVLDTSGSYGSTVAVVDPVNGNNATCVAVDSAVFNGVNDAATSSPCLNIYAAANAIAAYNNTNHARNDVGGGVIYLKEGSHVWTGGTTSAGARANANAWITITRFPGALRSNVLIATAAADKYIAKKVKLYDVKITNSTTTGFDNMDFIWFHACDLAATGSATVYNVKVKYMTDSTYISGDTFFSPYSVVNSAAGLVRGNTWASPTTTVIRPYALMGNLIKFQSGASVSADQSGQTTPAFENVIYAFNRIEHTSATSTTITPALSTYTESHGIAVANNVFERISGTSTPIIEIGADGTTGTPVNNVLIWHNTLVGQRANLAYNDYVLNDVTPPAWRKNWSIIGNVFDDYNCVTDIDSHGGTPDNDRVGNHAVIHGVGLRSNIVLNRVGVAGYENKFGGLLWSSGTNVNPYYVDDSSVVGDGTGGGDYHLTASSPGLNFVASGLAVLPYALDGIARANNGNGSVGAYEYGSDGGSRRRVIVSGGGE